ncbi:hypothetical protein [Variovorax guangxiensis]|uniref:hypothetical protein n=1 Tax=Variovorax guangxiensis TaxID=1775474 RepID=UPI0013868B45|nr:hypothetical protein [Variovorax guangxiensis]
MTRIVVEVSGDEHLLPSVSHPELKLCTEYSMGGGEDYWLLLCSVGPDWVNDESGDRR